MPWTGNPLSLGWGETRTTAPPVSGAHCPGTHCLHGAAACPCPPHPPPTMGGYLTWCATGMGTQPVHIYLGPIPLWEQCPPPTPPPSLSRHASLHYPLSTYSTMPAPASPSIPLSTLHRAHPHVAPPCLGSGIRYRISAWTTSLRHSGPTKSARPPRFAVQAPPPYRHFQVPTRLHIVQHGQTTWQRTPAAD